MAVIRCTRCENFCDLDYSDSAICIFDRRDGTVLNICDRCREEIEVKRDVDEWPTCDYCNNEHLIHYGESYWRCGNCDRDSESSEPPWKPERLAESGRLDPSPV